MSIRWRYVYQAYVGWISTAPPVMKPHLNVKQRKILLFHRILAFSRFNFDQSFSILSACCIYHWVLEDKI